MVRLVSELVIASIGLALTVISSTAALAYWLGRRFARLESEVRRLDLRITSEVGKLDSRMTFEVGKLDSKITAEVDRLDSKMSSEIGRLDSKMGSEVDKLDSRMTSEIGRLDSRMSSEIGRLDSRISAEANELKSAIGSIRASVSKLGTAFIESDRIILDYMSLKGLFTAEEAEFMVKRIQGLVSLATADPKKEELDFVLRVVSKKLDEMTIEEVDKAYEVALRWWKEELHELGIVVPIGLCIIRGYLLSRSRAKPEQARGVFSQP